ncbi:MAG: thiamine pyrophosphate-binding protein, partial [Streptosporangiaceae bacterium]
LGVDVVFGLCGHTIIALLDALRSSSIRFISFRHEQLAAHAADGYARASGKPGVLLLHVGPGLTCAATGVANAALDSIPMVVIAGDVPSYYFGRHPHQEVNLHQDADQFQIYRPFCKRVFRVARAADLPRAVERAFHLAQSGRPGPVLVDVPMDILSADLPEDAFSQPPPPLVAPGLAPETASHLAHALAAAERPVLYAGGGVISSGAMPALRALAEALELPVAHSLMGKGCLPEDHPLLLGMTGFWGTPLANDKCRTADLLLAVGTRFGEANSSSWDPRFTFAIPPTRLLQIDLDVAELGRNYPAELAAVADARLALEAVAEAARAMPTPRRPGLRAEIAAGRQAFAAHWSAQRASDQYPLRPERILRDVRQA